MLAAFASTVLARGDREVLEGQRHRNKEKERKGVREGRQESYEAQSRTKDQLLFRPALYHAPDLVLLDGEHLLSSERLDVDKGEAGGEQWEGDGRGPRLLAESQQEGEDGEADEGVPRHLRKECTGVSRARESGIRWFSEPMPARSRAMRRPGEAMREVAMRGRETAAIGEVQLREGAVVEQVVHFGQGDGVFGW